MNKDEQKLKLQEERMRGEEARQILESRPVKETLAQMKEATINKWQDTGDSATRDDLWQFYRAVRLFEEALTDAVTGGKFAEAELSDVMDKMKRVA